MAERGPVGAWEQWNLEREGCLRQHEGSIDIAKKSGKTQTKGDTPTEVRKAKAGQARRSRSKAGSSQVPGGARPR